MAATDRGFRNTSRSLRFRSFLLPTAVDKSIVAVINRSLVLSFSRSFVPSFRALRTKERENQGTKEPGYSDTHHRARRLPDDRIRIRAQPAHHAFCDTSADHQ